MRDWRVISICLVVMVVSWVEVKSVNGDPAADSVISGSRPVWYNGPINTQLVYQRSATGPTKLGESRAFPSPIYYAPAVTMSTTTTTTAAPLAAPRNYDVLKFFEKLKIVNDKFAKRNNAAVGTPKQLNEDVAEEEDVTAITSNSDDGGGVELEDRANRAVSSEDNAESINEGRKKFHSHGLIKFKTKGKKKISKLLYPIIVGLITAKSIIIPLFFKAVVVLSKFSFFVSTLSFIISSILGIKVLLLSNNNNRRSNDNTRVEVVHVPLQQKYPTTYSSSSSGGWIDRDSENKFIPITSADGERIIYEKPYSEQEKGLEKDSYLPL